MYLFSKQLKYLSVAVKSHVMFYHCPMTVFKNYNDVFIFMSIWETTFKSEYLFGRYLYKRLSRANHLQERSIAQPDGDHSDGFLLKTFTRTGVFKGNFDFTLEQGVRSIPLLLGTKKSFYYFEKYSRLVRKKKPADFLVSDIRIVATSLSLKNRLFDCMSEVGDWTIKSSGVINFRIHKYAPTNAKEVLASANVCILLQILLHIVFSLCWLMVLRGLPPNIAILGRRNSIGDSFRSGFYTVVNLVHDLLLPLTSEAEVFSNSIAFSRFSLPHLCMIPKNGTFDDHRPYWSSLARLFSRLYRHV